MNIVLTGIAGFAGSHIAETILATTDWNIIGIDRYSYAGRLDNLAHLDRKRITMVYHDFTQPLPPLDATYFIHNGAETHVKNSLTDPTPFVSANIMGTFNMLQAARHAKASKFLYVSTDEVFGAAISGHVENDVLTPSNPYAATKAAGEYLVKAWGTCFNVPYLITRSMNLFGSRQHVEKFIPMTVNNIKNGRAVDIHTDRYGNTGSRQWIHASDQARALVFLLQSDCINDVFHIAGEKKTNLQVAHDISTALDKSAQINLVNAYDLYPGHDLHYALDDSKIRAMGWSPKLTFEQGLKQSI